MSGHGSAQKGLATRAVQALALAVSFGVLFVLSHFTADVESRLGAMTAIGFLVLAGTLLSELLEPIGLPHLSGYLLAGIVGAFTAFSRARAKSPTFRFKTDALTLQLPVFGNIVKKVAVARFTRTLGTMISSGVPILDGLDIVARTAGNMVIEAELQATRKSISEGKTIAEPLQGSKIFPGMMVQMIAVGEETGSMEAMLNKVADFYDDEVDSAVAALTAMLEPLMMVFMGGSIGTILIAMYLPIFTIADTVG